LSFHPSSELTSNHENSYASISHDQYVILISKYSKILFIDLEDRQQIRDRWLHDAFAVGLPSSTSADQLNHNEYRVLAQKNSIDEDEAVRLLGDYGISEDKAKVRLQVNTFFLLFENISTHLFFIQGNSNKKI